MQGRRQKGESGGGGGEGRARGVSLLWQAKTAALLKLQCSATMPRCVCLCLHTSLCERVCAVWRAGRGVQGRDGEAGTDGKTW